MPIDEFEDDPLDLLEDDNDGVLESILLLDEEDRKPKRTGSGCAVLLLGAGSLAGTGWWFFNALRA